MSALHWDEVGNRFYETGVEKGVLYPSDGAGLAWNGLISVKEVEDFTPSSSYFQGEKLRNDHFIGGFAASIDAYTYPDILDTARDHSFGFTYRTETQNDLGETTYLLHLVYNVNFSPVEKPYETIGDDITLMTFEWTLSTLPISIPEGRPTAHFIIDSSKAYPELMTDLEDVLYGTDDSEPRLPDLDELLNLFEANSILKIIDHGDGMWSAIGPDDVVSMIDETTFQISWPSAVYISSDKYKVSSL